MLRNIKQFKQTTLGSTALALALIAGAPAALAGPDSHTDRHGSHAATPDNSRDHARKSVRDRAQDTAILHFANSSTLIGSTLRNSSTSDELGSINNFIVDRGSGRIVFAIVTTGDILGLGGKQFAIPYNQLRYMPTSESYTARMTANQVERQTEFLPDNWADLTQTSWMDSLTGWAKDVQSKTEDMIHDAVGDGDEQRVEGRVTSVSRRDMNGQEYAVVTVRDDDDRDHEVVVGPTWYVMGLDTRMSKDDDIEITTVKCDNRWVALTAEVNGDEIALRDEKGHAHWEAAKHQPKRYFLLSDLTGRSIAMEGSTFGEVQTSVIEAPSGYVAMIGLDPNENIFGIADTISLVPWSALHVSSALEVSLIGSQNEVERSMQMPDDLSLLRTPTSVAQAYSAFDEEMPSFTPRDQERTSMRRQHRDAMDRAGDAWGGESALTKAFADGDKVELQGVYRGLSSLEVEDGAPSATVLVLDTKDGRKNLILGPEWYVDRQDLDLSKGDQITVHGRTAKHNDRDWTAVWSIRRDNETWSFWDGDAPAWDG